MKIKIVMIIVVLLFFGCDSNVLDPIANDSNTDADIEEARIALNDGDYDDAISLMAGKYNASQPDLEVSRILASAYMGKAGVDLTYIIENADTGDSDNFDAIASALNLETTDAALQSSSSMFYKGSSSTEPKYITYASIASLLDNLEKAKGILDTINDYAQSINMEPEDDDVVQLGMASALHFITKVGEAVSTVTGYNIPLNKYAYREIFSVDNDEQTILNNLETYLDENPDIVSSLIGDLTNVYSAVTTLIDVIGADEDLSNDFDDFMRELLGLDSNASRVVIEAAIQQYTGKKITQFIQNELL